MKQFKIGDKVEFGKEPNALIPNIEGAGEILAMATDLCIIKTWIVLITRRECGNSTDNCNHHNIFYMQN